MRTIAICLCLSSLAQADCDTGTPLLIAWVNADNANNTARSEYLDAKQAYEKADNDWGQAQQTLATWEQRESDAERDWILHWLACPDCDAGNPDPTCEGDALESWWSLCVYYLNVAVTAENQAYETYCQAYVAKNEKLTVWNETEMNLEIAHATYWGHVNGPPACPDCN